MTALIPVGYATFGEERIQSVDGRMLYDFLGIARDYNAWMREQLERARLVAHRDYLTYEDVVQFPSGAKRVKSTTLTLDAAKHIAMLSQSQRGFEVRDYFIACERRAIAEAQKPLAELSRLDILKLAMESEEARIQAEKERDEAIKTKALIGSKREASAMATASAAKREANKLRDALGFNARHATVKAVEKATKAKYEWRPLRKYCDEHGLPATYVTDPLYGEVRAWPAGAWADVHGVDIAELFGEAA
jgi:phage anti-repressor protein